MPAQDDGPGASGRVALAPLASLLARRPIALALVAGTLMHLVLVALGLPGWPCPVHTVSGLPCPGCGLGHAVVLMWRGHWAAALEAHVFAPVLVVVMLLMCGALVLPPRAHGRFVRSVAVVERTTYVSLVTLSCLVLFWLWRVAVGLS